MYLGSDTFLGPNTFLGVPQPDVGSWYQLKNILDERRQYREEDTERLLMACPHDGEPYLTGPNGELYCRYDGYQPARGY